MSNSQNSEEAKQASESSKDSQFNDYAKSNNDAQFTRQRQQSFYDLDDDEDRDYSKDQQGRPEFNADQNSIKDRTNFNRDGVDYRLNSRDGDQFNDLYNQDRVLRGDNNLLRGDNDLLRGDNDLLRNPQRYQTTQSNATNQSGAAIDDKTGSQFNGFKDNPNDLRVNNGLNQNTPNQGFNNSQYNPQSAFSADATQLTNTEAQQKAQFLKDGSAAGLSQNQLQGSLNNIDSQTNSQAFSAVPFNQQANGSSNANSNSSNTNFNGSSASQSSHGSGYGVAASTATNSNSYKPTHKKPGSKKLGSAAFKAAVAKEENKLHYGHNATAKYLATEKVKEQEAKKHKSKDKGDVLDRGIRKEKREEKDQKLVKGFDKAYNKDVKDHKVTKKDKALYKILNKNGRSAQSTLSKYHRDNKKLNVKSKQANLNKSKSKGKGKSGLKTTNGTGLRDSTAPHVESDSLDFS